jgi:hypothetical protein
LRGKWERKKSYMGLPSPRDKDPLKKRNLLPWSFGLLWAPLSSAILTAAKAELFGCCSQCNRKQKKKKKKAQEISYSFLVLGGHFLFIQSELKCLSESSLSAQILSSGFGMELILRLGLPQGRNGKPI